jgi:hypothetical protein
MEKDEKELTRNSLITTAKAGAPITLPFYFPNENYLASIEPA